MVMFLLTLCVEVAQSQGGFEVQSSQFMSPLLGAAPQIQDPGYQVSPNLFSGAQEGPVLNIIPFLLSKRTMFW